MGGFRPLGIPENMAEATLSQCDSWSSMDAAEKDTARALVPAACDSILTTGWVDEQLFLDVGWGNPAIPGRVWNRQRFLLVCHPDVIARQAARVEKRAAAATAKEVCL